MSISRPTLDPSLLDALQKSETITYSYITTFDHDFIKGETPTNNKELKRLKSNDYYVDDQATGLEPFAKDYFRSWLSNGIPFLGLGNEGEIIRNRVTTNVSLLNQAQTELSRLQNLAKKSHEKKEGQLAEELEEIEEENVSVTPTQIQQQELLVDTLQKEVDADYELILSKLSECLGLEKSNPLVAQAILGHKQALFSMLYYLTTQSIVQNTKIDPNATELPIFLALDQPVKHTENLLVHNGNLYLICSGADSIIRQGANKKVEGIIPDEYQIIYKVGLDKNQEPSYQMVAVRSNNPMYVNILKNEFSMDEFIQHYCSDEMKYEGQARDINYKLAKLAPSPLQQRVNSFLENFKRVDLKDPTAKKELFDFMVALSDMLNSVSPNTYKEIKTFVATNPFTNPVLKELDINSFFEELNIYIKAKRLTDVEGSISKLKRTESRTSFTKAFEQTRAASTLTAEQAKRLSLTTFKDQKVEEPIVKSRSTRKKRVRPNKAVVVALSKFDENFPNAREGLKSEYTLLLSYLPVNAIPEVTKFLRSIHLTPKLQNEEAFKKAFNENSTLTKLALNESALEAIKIFANFISKIAELNKIEEIEESVIRLATNPNIATAEQIEQTIRLANKTELLKELQEHVVDAIQSSEYEIAAKVFSINQTVEKSGVIPSPFYTTLTANLNTVINNYRSENQDIFYAMPSISDYNHVAKKIQPFTKEKDTLKYQDFLNTDSWLDDAIKLATFALFDEDGNNRKDIQILFDMATEKGFLEKTPYNELVKQYVLRFIARIYDSESSIYKITASKIDERLKNGFVYIPSQQKQPELTIPFAKLKDHPKLIEASKETLKNSALLKEIVDNQFFTKGRDDVALFRRNYLIGSSFLCQRQAHLGYDDVETLPQSRQERTKITNQITHQQVQKLLGISEEKATKVIASHSPDLVPLIQRILNGAIGAGNMTSPLKIQPPHSSLVSSNLTKDENGNILMIVSGKGFVISDSLTHQKGFLNVNYTITYRLNDLKNGYDLISTSVDDNQIRLLLEGAQIREEEVRKNYFTDQNTLKGWLFHFDRYLYETNDTATRLLIGDIISTIHTHAILNNPISENEFTYFKVMFAHLDKIRDDKVSLADVNKFLEFTKTTGELTPLQTRIHSHLNALAKRLPERQNEMLVEAINTKVNKVNVNNYFLRSLINQVMDEIQANKTDQNIQVMNDYLKQFSHALDLNEPQEILEAMVMISSLATHNSHPNIAEKIQGLSLYYRLFYMNDFYEKIFDSYKPVLLEGYALTKQNKAWINLIIAEALSVLFDKEGNVNPAIAKLYPSIKEELDLDKNENKLKFLVWYMDNIRLPGVENELLLAEVKQAIYGKIEPLLPLVDENYIDSFNNLIRENLNADPHDNRSTKQFNEFEELQYSFLYTQSLNGLKAASESLLTSPINTEENKSPIDTLVMFAMIQENESEALRLNAETREDKLLIVDHNISVANLIKKPTTENYDACAKTSEALYKRTWGQYAAGIGFAALGVVLTILAIPLILAIKTAPIGILGVKIGVELLATGLAICGIGALASYKYSWSNFFSHQPKISNDVKTAVDTLDSQVKTLPKK